MKKLGRVRLALLIALLLLAGGGLFVACGGLVPGPAPEASPEAGSEACDGQACDRGLSPEGSSSADAAVTSKDGSTPASGASDASDASDTGRDARPLAPCEDGGLPGMLDPTFGDGGFVYMNLDPDAGSVTNTVVIQPDGKTVLGGSIFGSSMSRFALVRLTAAGTLDTGFGVGGIVDTPIPVGRGGGVDALALTGDGRIVAAGMVTLDGGVPSVADFAITRYSPGGTLDGAFGDGGIAFAGIPPEAALVRSVAVLPDGHVLAAGTVGSNLSSDYAIVKFNPNGSLDTTFGSSGKATVNIRSLDGAGAMVLQPDGKSLVVGSSAPVTTIGGMPVLGPADLSAVRLNADGSLDPSFGSAGRVVLALATESGASAMLVDSSGRIVLGGTTGNSTSRDFGVFRLTSGGAVDPTFGLGGVVRTDFGAADVIMKGGLYIQPDGNYVAAGRSNVGVGAPTDALARYLPNGAPDLAFGTGGRVVMPNPPGFYVNSHAAAFSGNRATLAGQWTPSGGRSSMGASRYCL